MKPVRSLLFVTTILAILAISAAAVSAQEPTSAASSVETLRAQLVEVQTKETDLQSRARQLEEALKPENIEHSFTMTIQTTAYDARGKVVSTSTATSYHSANGDWRYLINVDGYDRAMLYRVGRGVYTADARTRLILKSTSHAPGCGFRTTDQLLRDPSYERTENILGFEAHFLRQPMPFEYGTIETSYVAELSGRVPFKRIYIYGDGRRIVEEPTAVILGEPAIADLKGPDYPMIDQVATYDKLLETKAVEHPEPMFPADADSGGFGDTVFVSVVIDEKGNVLTANSNTPITFLADPAVAAAYQTKFEPVYRNGKPVIGAGLLRYKFFGQRLARN